MKYVCTAEQLEESMEQANYNYEKAGYNEHNRMWDSLV